MLALTMASGLLPSFPDIKSQLSAMFAVTFSDTIRTASCTAAGPPCARRPMRIAITMFDSAASAQTSMLMSNQLGFLGVAVMPQP